MQRIFISSVQKEFAAERCSVLSKTHKSRTPASMHGLPEPTFALTDGFVTTIWRSPELALAHVEGESGQVTPQVTPQVAQLLAVLKGDMSRAELMTAIGLKDRGTFSANYLEPALAAQWIERTLPDSPHSPTQKYRRTPKGQ